MNTKEDPSRLELRAKPRPIRRLNRRLIVVLAAALLLAVALVLMWGLRKPAPKQAQASVEKRNVERVARAEGLESLPRDYSAIPKPLQLGAPIGELGRPVLRAEREAGIPVLPERPTYHPSPEEDATRAQRLREQGEIEAASKAGVLVKLERRSTTPVTSPAAIDGASDELVRARSMASDVSGTGGSGTSDPNHQDRKRAFLDAPVDSPLYSSASLRPATSPYQLTGGVAIISAALVTGIKSDLPGDIIAMVTANAYDTTEGRYLLIPQGSWLFGRYDSQISFGQRRVLIVWNRLTLPNGSSIVLDRLKGVDAGGYAGLEDDVDSHWSRIFAGAAVSTLLGASAELASPTRSDSEGRVVIATREGIQDSINQVGQEMTRRNMDIQQTLTVRPGFPLRVVINRDLVLQPYKTE